MPDSNEEQKPEEPGFEETADEAVEEKLQSALASASRGVFHERIKNDFTYHQPKEGQPLRYTFLRDSARDLALKFIDNTPASREQSLALTKLEEAVMWANAAIARNE